MTVRTALIALVFASSVAFARAETLRLPDVPVTGHDGITRAFRSEAVGDRLVVVAAIYTDCTTICPITTVILQDLQGRLGDRLGAGVRLLAVTLDPARDTPARLAAAAREAGAREGWLWLTGRKRDLDRLTAAIGAYSADFTEHPPVFLVGDGARGVWRRLYGFPSAEELLAVLDELARAREGGAS